MAINLDGEDGRRGVRRKYMQHRSYIAVLAYLSVFFCGVFVWTTYEQPNDVALASEKAKILAPQNGSHMYQPKSYIASSLSMREGFNAYQQRTNYLVE